MLSFFDFEVVRLVLFAVGFVSSVSTDLSSAVKSSRCVTACCSCWATFNIQNTDAQETEKRITDFVKKMNDIRFKASWGLSALEGIVRGNEDIRDSHIPSLVYFGVDNEKSLAFRMVGAPRALAFSLQNILDKNLNEYSYKDLRNRIKGLTNSDWDGLKPSNSSLSGIEWKRISEILVN